jgi:hypothetical protein
MKVKLPKFGPCHVLGEGGIERQRDSHCSRRPAKLNKLQFLFKGTKRLTKFWHRFPLVLKLISLRRLHFFIPFPSTIYACMYVCMYVPETAGFKSIEQRNNFDMITLVKLGGMEEGVGINSMS